MDILFDLVKYLELKRPFSIRLFSRENKKVDALYEAIYSDKRNNLSHRITVYLGNRNRSISACIAHELIHAKQEEKKLTEYHGPFFRKMARSIEREFRLEGVYIPDLDIENPKI